MISSSRRAIKIKISDYKAHHNPAELPSGTTQQNYPAIAVASLAVFLVFWNIVGPVMRHFNVLISGIIGSCNWDDMRVKYVEGSHS